MAATEAVSDPDHDRYQRRNTLKKEASAFAARSKPGANQLVTMVTILYN